MGVFEKTVIAGKDILEFIPQRDPIVMVDKFWGIENNMSISGLTINKDNIFCEEGRLTECGLIEHIAQSAALRVGYIYKSKGLDIPLGYIGSINKFRMIDLPLVNQQILTEITILQEVMNISLIAASVLSNGDLIAECQMKIFLQE